MERYIGMDVHAASCTLAVISEKGRKLKDFPVETNGQALVEAVRMIPGDKTVKLPARSPDLNAYAERFVLSIRSECLDQITPLGERHLRTAVREYTEHYHVERNHQGRGNELIETPCEEPNMDGAVECQERLGGVLRYYRRAA